MRACARDGCSLAADQQGFVEEMCPAALEADPAPERLARRPTNPLHKCLSPKRIRESGSTTRSGCDLKLAVDLSEKQWEVLAPLLPKPRIRKDQRGRPWRDPRDVLNGILWILRTGAVGRLTGSVSIEVDLPSAVSSDGCETGR